MGKFSYFKEVLESKPNVVAYRTFCLCVFASTVLGRGGGTNNHEGNVRFRQLVSNHKMRYLACSKVDKPKVARDVVDIWRKLNPPGRFLQRKDESKKGTGSVRDDCVVWIEVDDQEARKKASQCLREKTPDVKPFIDQLNQQQEEVVEKNTSKSSVKVHPEKGKKATPNSAGSNDANELAAQGSGVTDLPDRPISAKVDSMRRDSMPGRNSITGRPPSVNLNAMRRGSMPALVHSASEGFAGMPSGPANLRMHDRRVSLPAVNQLQGYQARVFEMEQLMTRQEQVLRDAYSAIERTGDTDASSIAGLQVQEQLISNRQMMMQQQYMAMKARMLEARNGQTMPEPISMGMSQQTHGSGGFPQQMNERTQSLIQQQQMLAREQQRLLAEQERLVRQEHMLAMAAQSQQVKPSAVISDQNEGSASFTEDELEPLPLDHGIVTPLLISPDVQVSRGGAQFETMPLKGATKETAREYNHGPSTRDQDRAKLKPVASDERKDDAEKAVDGKIEDISKSSSASQGRQRDEFDPKDTLLEYRKTLESYVTTNHGSIPSLEMNEDGAEQLGVTVNGVPTSDWIEEQLLNDSGLHDSGDVSTSKRRPLQRSNSKKSMMSLGNSTDMSFAFSDMEYSLDLSTKGDSKRNANRSMSILSHNSHMSELTDFDDLDVL